MSTCSICKDLWGRRIGGVGGAQRREWDEEKRGCSGEAQGGGGVVDQGGFSARQAPSVYLRGEKGSAAAVTTPTTWVLQKDAQMFKTAAVGTSYVHPISVQNTAPHGRTQNGWWEHYTVDLKLPLHLTRPTHSVGSHITLASAAVGRSHIICSFPLCCCVEEKAKLSMTPSLRIFRGLSIFEKGRGIEQQNENNVGILVFRWQ